MSKPTAEEVMRQAQVFASAWSLIDSPLGGFDAIEHAEHEKERLHQMVKVLVEQGVNYIPFQVKVLSMTSESALLKIEGQEFWQHRWVPYSAIAKEDLYAININATIEVNIAKWFVDGRWHESQMPPLPA